MVIGYINGMEIYYHWFGGKGAPLGAISLQLGRSSSCYFRLARPLFLKEGTMTLP